MIDSDNDVFCNEINGARREQNRFEDFSTLDNTDKSEYLHN